MNDNQVSKNKPCEKLLKLIGDYWTLNIIEAVGKKEYRFCELERLLPTINPVTLTSRLKSLEYMNLIERHKEDKIAVIYKLTLQGKKLIPIATSIRKFAENFVHTK